VAGTWSSLGVTKMEFPNKYPTKKKGWDETCANQTRSSGEIQKEIEYFSPSERNKHMSLIFFQTKPSIVGKTGKSLKDNTLATFPEGFKNNQCESFSLTQRLFFVRSGVNILSLAGCFFFQNDVNSFCENNQKKLFLLRKYNSFFLGWVSKKN